VRGNVAVKLARGLVEKEMPKSLRGMHPVLAEADRVRQFVGDLIDVHLYADIGERCHDRRMEIRHRLGMRCSCVSLMPLLKSFA
jgi:hypothetical protein